MAKFLKIEKKDALNTGREKLNNAIDGSEESVNRSIDADNKATQALANSESTQTQLNTIVIDGDSSVEAAQARVDEKGISHSTLKERIDDGMNSVNQQLAQTEQELIDAKDSLSTQINNVDGKVMDLQSQVTTNTIFLGGWEITNNPSRQSLDFKRVD